MLIHAVLEGFAAVDEDNGDFVIELAAQLIITVHVDLMPIEAPPTMELRDRLFDDLAEMASLPRINHNLVEH
jgi:hypothetical protein